MSDTSVHKLSASALSTFLRSPRAYYWRYKARLEPLEPSAGTYDHDKIAGILWSEFVDRFYKGVSEAENTRLMLEKWDDQTAGWLPDRFKTRLTNALESWATTYYQKFSPSDGCRNGSEKLVENERFIGYLDGLSHDLVVHEVKSTSRSQQVSEQLWKVQNSIQVKLYCVMVQATGICIEFAYKDTPYGIFRAPVLPVTEGQRKAWESELNALADMIYSLGDDPNHYPCHSDGCCYTGKNSVSMCPYSALCSMGLTEETRIGYKDKEHRK